jgi:hypothetical protein
MPILAVSPALDLFVGTAVVFFVLASISAAVNEAIQTTSNARGAYLARGIRTLLKADGQGDQELEKELENFYDHWRIERLCVPAGSVRKRLRTVRKWLGETRYVSVVGKRLPHVNKRRRPSYIPAREFALSVLDTATPAAPPTIGAELLRRAQRTIDQIGIESAQGGRTTVLGAAAEQRQDALRAELERSFDAVMARCSGWYKRYVQWWLLLLAVLLAFGLNTNAYTVGERLWTASDTATRLHLPIGWNAANPGPGDGLPAWLAGCLVTVAALTLGAPFWFDVLTRFANLRGTGDAEDIGNKAESY